MKIVKNICQELIRVENVFAAWREFRRGKGGKRDVLLFERNLEDNLFALRDELAAGTYRHGGYRRFYVHDPKFRVINKASVRDRVLHHLVFAKLYEIYDPCFVNESYSSRVGKGPHAGVADLESALKTVSRNFTKRIFALKGDVKKFFDSVNHAMLLEIIARKIKDADFMRLIENIIRSFGENRGLPLGNVTSQIFANIYLNELDQFIKQALRCKHYFRYADDFAILRESERELSVLRAAIDEFLQNNLALRLHNRKTFVVKHARGLDFCGYVLLPHYRTLRTRTKQRMFKKSAKKFGDFVRGRVDGHGVAQSLSSYFGVLQHCQGWGIGNELLCGDHC